MRDISDDDKTSGTRMGGKGRQEVHAWGVYLEKRRWGTGIVDN